MNKYLVTAALPYANGDIHIGHMVEHCQLDIWVRAKKMQGLECYSFCADDTHGTPIMLSAKDRGIAVEEFILELNQRHKEDFMACDIHYDHYSMTDTDVNEKLVIEIYEQMKKDEHLSIKEIEQYFCHECQMFLPDRFLKGTCPVCKSVDQNGDSCDKCGSTYKTIEIVDPYCVLCGKDKSNISLKKTEQIFFKLNAFKSFLLQWVDKVNSKEVVNKLREWLKDDLQDWNISRDSPYFGFKIPDQKDKYFYVWVDAPVGYIATTEEWTNKNNKKLEDFWCNEEVKIVHFIGKDIIYFHSLFWPSMLKNSRFNLPSSIYTHGFLTVNGEKMSKSKGTQILVRDYLKHLDINYLRYYMGTKLNSSIEDIDFSVMDFKSKVNSDLIGKITNICSRGAQMIEKHFDRELGKNDLEGFEICKNFRNKKDKIVKLYDDLEYNKVTIMVREMAEELNRYFDLREPWKLVKIDRIKTQSILTSLLEGFKIMIIYLTPVIPSYSKKVQSLFNEDHWNFDSVDQSLENKKINSFEHLLKRIDEEDLKKVF